MKADKIHTQQLILTRAAQIVDAFEAGDVNYDDLIDLLDDCDRFTFEYAAYSMAITLIEA